jgi:hypothetical protein
MQTKVNIFPKAYYLLVYEGRKKLIKKVQKNLKKQKKGFILNKSA